MRSLLLAALTLFALGAAAGPVDPVGEPVIHASHVEVEILSDGRAGVRTVAAEGSSIWLQWIDRGQDVSLTVEPMGTGNPGEIVWHGEEAGRDRLTFRSTWPGDCPCKLEMTSGDDVVMTWTNLNP